MPKTKTTKKTKSKTLKEIRKVENYEYLLVEYLKEMSNEITYLLLVVSCLFLYLLIDFLPSTYSFDQQVLKAVFIVLILGGFGLFGLSNATKRKIEEKFEAIFS